MKILRKLSEEKGSITMTVVAAMLFITAAILIAYFSLSNQSNDQSKKTRQIADSYKVTNTDLVQKYKDVQDNLNEVTTMSITEVKSLGNTMLAKETNTVVNDELGNNFVVPAGFKVTDDANDIIDGIVIQDKAENEWVWIPVSVEDLNKMYSSGSIEYTLLGTNVKTTYKTLGTTLGTKTINRSYPGEYHDPYLREPDVLSGEEYDGNPQNRINAGFVENDGITANSLEVMARKMKDDYENMIRSINKNGGFYVGRYELGKDENGIPRLKKGQVLNDKGWYKFYNLCKSFNTKSVESRMIWSCQWDQICRFISKYKNQNGQIVERNLDDSSSYGNFTGSLNSTTGQNDDYKTNNIYDLAGNCNEATQEAYYKTQRVYRGSYAGSSSQKIVTAIASNFPNTNLGSYEGARPVLYIK